MAKSDTDDWITLNIGGQRFLTCRSVFSGHSGVSIGLLFQDNNFAEGARVHAGQDVCQPGAKHDAQLLCLNLGFDFTGTETYYIFLFTYYLCLQILAFYHIFAKI